MVGSNTLKLNHASMKEALQEYLTKRMPTESLTITSVGTDKDSGAYRDSVTFVIEFNIEEGASTSDEVK